MKKTLPLSEELAPVKHMISVTMAEVAACLIRVLKEVIKTRMQSQRYGALIFLHVTAIPTLRATKAPTFLQLSSKLNRKPLYARKSAACLDGSLGKERWSPASPFLRRPFELDKILRAPPLLVGICLAWDVDQT
ncbi:hypothetical protein BDZ97DRAFT_1920115 [Flammula alnicola]|nr:hypothetical protein BDZ97DRAFT_1920115 [Flammula alnicola]